MVIWVSTAAAITQPHHGRSSTPENSIHSMLPPSVTCRWVLPAGDLQRRVHGSCALVASPRFQFADQGQVRLDVHGNLGQAGEYLLFGAGHVWHSGTPALRCKYPALKP